jgi:hypothetical protein
MQPSFRIAGTALDVNVVTDLHPLAASPYWPLAGTTMKIAPHAATPTATATASEDRIVLGLQTFRSKEEATGHPGR